MYIYFIVGYVVSGIMFNDELFVSVGKIKEDICENMFLFVCVCFFF